MCGAMAAGLSSGGGIERFHEFTCEASTETLAREPRGLHWHRRSPRGSPHEGASKASRWVRSRTIFIRLAFVRDSGVFSQRKERLCFLMPPYFISMMAVEKM